MLTRGEFIEEFGYRYEPGQHVLGLGPTGRGKTTLFGQILPHAKTSGVLISSLGTDPALAHLGKPCRSWPPKVPVRLLQYDENPLIRRFEAKPTSPSQFPAVRAVNSSMLTWMFGREDWTIFFPDLQVISDPKLMGLGKEVEQLLLTLRKSRSSVWMDAQAPRWIPSAAKDQVQHLFVWRNRDEAMMKRLREISGVDPDMMVEMFRSMDSFYDLVWIDARRDDYFIVEAT